MKKQNIFGGVMVLAILLAFGLACNQYGEKLEFNKGELYYTKNVPESDAKKLGEYLVKEGVFADKPATVQLDKEGGTFQVRMVIIEEKRNDEGYANVLKNFASQISSDVFNDAPVEVHICDDNLKTLKVIKP